MLCPEVWHYEAPAYRISVRRHAASAKPDVAEETTSDRGARLVGRIGEAARHTISAHYFNHAASITLPNTSSIPESFYQSIIEDSDYYRVNGLRAVELVNKEFVEAFVKKGELTLLAIGRRVDVDNLIALLPCGELILSLTRPSYQSLGLEGRPTRFERKQPSRYVVRINLKDEHLSPGKKYYEKIHKSLDKLQDSKFDVIIAWDPPEERMCPSSVAAWFANRGYSISVCHQKVTRRTEYSLEIPLLEDGCNYDEFFEWLGLFSIDGNLVNEGQEAEYVSSYRCPSPRLSVPHIHYLQLSGLLTRRRLARISELLHEYATALEQNENRKVLPWCSLDVQGFADSPVNWGMQEHSHYVDGDNSYTLVISPNSGDYLLRRSMSSCGKPKIMQ